MLCFPANATAKIKLLSKDENSLLMTIWIKQKEILLETVHKNHLALTFPKCEWTFTRALSDPPTFFNPQPSHFHGLYNIWFAWHFHWRVWYSWGVRLTFILTRQIEQIVHRINYSKVTSQGFEQIVPVPKQSKVTLCGKCWFSEWVGGRGSAR